MTIGDLDNYLIPLNRKERFYTGTVLPGIVCADGLAHLGRFLALIPGVEALPVDGDPQTANVQFFTEYNLTESVAVGPHATEFSDRPKTGDTPDALIALSGPPKTLIGVEAKVFDVVAASDLRVQMDRQKTYVLDYLAHKRGFDHVFSIALLPEKLAGSLHLDGVLVVTWEQVLDAYEDVEAAAHYWAVLRLAMDLYDDLKASDDLVFGANAETKLSGDDIVSGMGEADFPFTFVGRGGGLKGKKLAHDLKNQSWRTRLYEVTSAQNPPNHNWFPVAVFKALVGGIDAPDE